MKVVVFTKRSAAGVLDSVSMFLPGDSESAGSRTKHGGFFSLRIIIRCKCFVSGVHTVDHGAESEPLVSNG